MSKVIRQQGYTDLRHLNDFIDHLEDGDRLFWEGLDEDVYRQAQGYSTSELKEAYKSPAHWLAYKNRPPVYKPHFNFGTMVHMAILEPDRLENDLFIKPTFLI